MDAPTVTAAQNPLVSIYIPTHNRSEMLLRAVQSAINQTYHHTEIIVVNDGSTDDTEEVLKGLAQQHLNLKFITNPTPLGACKSRNLAIQQAKGTFVTGLDDDDEFTPDRIEIFVKQFNPKYAFLAASIIEDDGAQRINLTLDSGEISLNNLLTYNRVGNQVFCLKERVLSVGGFDEGFPAFQDYDLWTRLLEKYGPCLKLKDATYIMYTGHEKHRITSNPEKRMRALNMFIDKHKAHFSKSNFKAFELLKKEILNEPLSTVEYLKFLSVDNLKPATGMYLDSHFKFLKKLVNMFR